MLQKRMVRNKGTNRELDELRKAVGCRFAC